MTDQNREIESVFHQVRQIRDAIERAAFLDRACAGDGALRARIEKLLAAEAELGSFLSSVDETVDAPSSARSSSGPVATAISSALSEKPGTVIGRYKLLQQLGEGGMGIVYLAEQTKPIQRQVALKIIKLGMDTRQVIARFEAERQALAMMDHPHIARVLDAGATETGRPYFVMELVKGMPITDYCDKENVSLRDRLSLFMNVCSAVQHAHQKGIIHRDIKPSNILVTLHDGKPVPKVIDFGIAKATEQKLTERTMFTEYGQFIGTPAYMSPEQAEMSGLDIDTRSDIYSLGVVLYELLTGATPFDARTLRAAAIDEIRRIIREDEPSKPSTRLSTVREELATVAKRRGVEPQKLGSILRGDLDWIVMKALEKDRQRRYESATGFGADIQRYLSGEAVVAAPPSAAYRFQKFVRRNKGVVTAGAAVALSLLVGLIGFAWQAQIAGTQRDLARTRLNESEATVQFLDEMLAAVDPLAHGKDVTVRAVLDQAARTMDTKFADRPLVAARLHGTIGRTYMGLGTYDSADTNIREALAIRRRELGPNHEDTCRAVNDLGHFLIKSGEHAECEAVLKEAVVHHERLFGRGHEITVQSIDALGTLYASQVRFKESEPLVKEVLERRTASLGREHPDTIAAMNTLAILYTDMSRFDEAEKLFETAIAAQRRNLGPDHPHALAVRADLAWMLYWAASQEEDSDPGGAKLRIAKSREIGEQVLEARVRVLGEEHQDTLSSMNNLAQVYKESGLHEQADALRKKDLEICLRVLGEEHPDTITSLANMGNSLRNRGKCDEALPYLERAVRNARKSLPPEGEGMAFNLGWYGSCLRELGRYAESEPLLIEARAIIGKLHGDEHPIALEMNRGLMMLYEAWDKADPGMGHDAQAVEWKKRLPARPEKGKQP